MNLRLARPSRPFPVATQTRAGEPYEHMTPRLAALRHVREKIADRKAGLDPYDKHVFILEAQPHEVVYSNRMLEILGSVLSTTTVKPDGGKRFRARVAWDIRDELGLDSPHPPLMDDEPLASRGIGQMAESADDAIMTVLHPAQPTLELVVDNRDIVGGNIICLNDEARQQLDIAARKAAMRIDCGCGAPAGQACRCTVGERIASALERDRLVDDEKQAH